jgi:beta-phosphoglucomutase family hydrolase
MKKAFLFDMNGTMVDDMQYHVIAWHQIVNELGANLSLEEMKRECYGKNEELLERIFPGRFTIEEKNIMSLAKEQTYQQTYKPHLQLLPGLAVFIEKAKRAGVKMGIGSAAITYNIDFVLDGLGIRHYFDAIVSADDVQISKPDPETFTKCADQLEIAYGDCLVFEDATKGVEAAERAGMESVVITSFHEPEDFDHLPGILFFAKDYEDSQLEALFSK